MKRCLVALRIAAIPLLWPAVSSGQPASVAQALYDEIALETLAAFKIGNFNGMRERFAASFYAQVPLQSMNQIPASYQTRFGRISNVRFLERKPDPSFGHGTLFFQAEIEGNRAAILRMLLDAGGQITAWHLGPSFDVQISLEDFTQEVQALPGTVSIHAQREGVDRAFFEHNATIPLPIGSTFKLYVLAALLQDCEKGELSLDTVVRLSRENRSLPSGELQSWPSGAPLTLQTLATLMIMRSDNTATDHLIDSVGRQRIEQALGGQLPHSAVDRAVPFLKTREFFILGARGPSGQERRQRYLQGNLATKREILTDLADDELPPLSAVTGEFSSEIEWFASTRDLTHLLEALYSGKLLQRQESRDVLRAILGINPGVPNTEQDARIAYLGYKGGSERGVLNLTQCVETSEGIRFYMSMTWHRPGQNIDNETFVALMNKLRKLFVDALDS